MARLPRVLAFWCLGSLAFSAQVEAESGHGRRAQRVCTMEYDPVCGDLRGTRRTFGNRCLAEREGAGDIASGVCGVGPSPR